MVWQRGVAPRCARSRAQDAQHRPARVPTRGPCAAAKAASCVRTVADQPGRSVAARAALPARSAGRGRRHAHPGLGAGEHVRARPRPACGRDSYARAGHHDAQAARCMAARARCTRGVPALRCAPAAASAGSSARSSACARGALHDRVGVRRLRKVRAATACATGTASKISGVASTRYLAFCKHCTKGRVGYAAVRSCVAVGERVARRVVGVVVFWKDGRERGLWALCVRPRPWAAACKPLWETRSVFQGAVGGRPTWVTSKVRPQPRQRRQRPQAPAVARSPALAALIAQHGGAHHAPARALGSWPGRTSRSRCPSNSTPTQSGRKALHAGCGRRFAGEIV